MIPLDEVCRASRLLKRGDRVLCALSGGVDSVVLTHVLCALRAELALTVAAAHFTHGLRPEAAAPERELVQALCASLGIECFCGEGDTRAQAEACGQTPEEAARTLRYAFLERTADAWQADKIATAHHSEDNLETMLLNLARGTGLRGLCGIPPVRGRIVRPLLAASRTQIEQYAAAQGLAWATDETNGDVRYARNRIRHEIVPALLEINRSAVQNASRTATLLRADSAFLEDAVQALLATAQEYAGGVAMEAKRILQAPSAVAGRAVRALYARAGGGLADMTQAHADAVLALCRAEKPSAQCTLPGKLTARREYDLLVIAPRQGAETAENRCALTRVGDTVWGGWTITVGGQPKEGCAVAYLAQAEANTALFVRARRPGDTISTAGGTKSIKKYMIEQKIPQIMRDSWPVICDNKKIRAVPLFGAPAPHEAAVAITARRNHR